MSGSGAATPTIDNLLDRIERLRLRRKVVAQEAGLNRYTLYRLHTRSDRVQARTLRNIERVIIGYERGELMRLLDLHGSWLNSADYEEHQIAAAKIESAGLTERSAA